MRIVLYTYVLFIIIIKFQKKSSTLELSHKVGRGIFDEKVGRVGKMSWELGNSV